MTDDVLDELGRMPEDLVRLAAGLEGKRAGMRPPDGSFAFVEHVWHLADLETQGFAERIRRLRAEENPALPDFDGARVARERDYRRLAVADGLEEFSRARAANLAALRSLSDAERSRAGTQEGIGRVTLGEIPFRMLEHDRSHRGELDALRRLVAAAIS